MTEITPEEFEEYQILKNYYRQETLRQSIDKVVSLEQDVDLPIKRSVMMLALLELEPMWSCCGFDYAGQPIHKAHQYGAVRFVLRETEPGWTMQRDLFTSGPAYHDYANAWTMKIGEHYGRRLFYLTSDSITGNAWPDLETIHYSEPAAISIALLEEFLERFRDRFSDEVTLLDTNQEFQKAYTWWQYPPRSPWVIRRADL